jgi:outer membrane autotransporter protein
MSGTDDRAEGRMDILVKEWSRPMKLIAISAAGALVAGSALAGGVNPAPVEPVLMNPAPPVVMSSEEWTGGYAGLSLGYGAVDTDAGTFLNTNSQSIAGLGFDGDGAIGGAFAGYQYDFGQFVLGGEVDLNAANLDFDQDGFRNNTTGVNGGAEFDELHRLKLRAGYDAGNALIYGVAGAAYMSGSILTQDVSDTGYVVGAGVDYKVAPNVTVGGEVLYHRFDDFDETGIDFDATTVQARVAYQF